MGPFDETKCPISKTVGMASEVTLITPIKKGRVEGEYRTYLTRLKSVLDGLQQRETQQMPTPVGFLRQIHFARWVILDPRPGDGQASLMFTSNFDGEMKHYFRNFALNLTGDIDRVWENCEGYPGAGDFDKLWRYVKEHQVETSTFYNAYRTLTVPQILKLAAFKESFDKLIGPHLALDGRAAAAPDRLADQLRALCATMQPKATPGREPAMTLGGSQPSGCAGGVPTRALATDDIQANILASPPWKQAGYFFLRITKPDEFRASLWRLTVDRGKALGFATAEDFNREKPGRTLERSFNIAFTWSGLKRLGLAEEHLAALPLAFREGMAARARILGDIGGSAPDKWDGLLGSTDVHAVIGAFSMKEAKDAAEAYWRQIKAEVTGCEVVGREFGCRLERDNYAVEPFGFRHGISQPEIEGVGPGRNGGSNGVRRRNAVPAGEFILGYRDADGNDQIAPDLVSEAVRELCANGSFMVFRKLEQNVKAFNDFKDQHGPEVAHRLMGRRPDGTSLALPDKTENALAAVAGDKPGSVSLDDFDLDDFDYRHDKGGVKCPFASHVRRANPRDDVADEEGRRHRIIRRGIPYGEADGEKQGVLFVCFNARIDTQFEFLQSEWCNKGDFLGHFTDVRDPIVGRDPVVGDGGGVFAYPHQSMPVNDIKRLVTVKGGDYFFIPGVKALGSILDGTFDGPSTAPAANLTVAEAPATFDPVAYASEIDAGQLLRSRQIDVKRVSWPSGREQAIYFVACRDHAREILADDTRFTSAQYARRIDSLLDGYDYTDWLREGEKPGPERLVLRRVLLGMRQGDREKQARLAILRQALGAADTEAIKQHMSANVGAIAKKVAGAAIEAAKAAGGLDVVTNLGYAVPIERAIQYFGYPRPTKLSDAYIALHFDQPSIEAVSRLGWLDQFRKDPAAKDPAPELLGLVHAIAIFLLIDNYDTPVSLAYAKLAVKELLDRLAEEIIREEKRIEEGVSGTTSVPDTLLRRMLRCDRDGAEPATFRLRVGMILAELIVGGVDTAAKAITNVVDCLLSNPEALECAKAAVDDDETLNDIILEALRLQPVAPLIIRECPNGAESPLFINGQQRPFGFEAGSRLFLLTEAAMCDPAGGPQTNPLPLDLSKFLLPGDVPPALKQDVDRIRRLSFGDGSHGCLGSEIVLAELREVLRQLLTLNNLRRAAGPEGQKRESLALPVSLKVRFDADDPPARAQRRPPRRPPRDRTRGRGKDIAPRPADYRV